MVFEYGRGYNLGDESWRPWRGVGSGRLAFQHSYVRSIDDEGTLGVAGRDGAVPNGVAP
jgi:hypothetical protein